MLILFQILFIMFSFVALYNIYLRHKQGQLGPKGMVFWLLFWILADLAVIWPDTTTVAANYVGIGRGTDFILYISLAVIFFLLFRLNLKIESVGRDITKLTRHQALMEKKSKDS